MKDYTGQRFRHLELLCYARPGGSGVGAVWKARCDCGKVQEVVAKSVVAGRVGSCGKCKYHRDLIKSEKERRLKLRSKNRQLLSSHISHASRKNLKWELSVKEFDDLVSQGCCLCEEKVQGVHSNRSDGHYTPGECFGLCGWCTRMLDGRKLEELLNKVSFIISRIKFD